MVSHQESHRTDKEKFEQIKNKVKHVLQCHFSKHLKIYDKKHLNLKRIDSYS